MIKRISQRLDPLTLPLFGERLIEASAGTGKTFTISALYLRLLLGLGQEAAFLRPLMVEEILVLTFTKASAEELRCRIRKNIHDMRIACVRGKSQESLLSEILNEIGDPSKAIVQLLSAERQMDEAAIYTIHGFCHRVLTQNAFESGMLFEQTLLNDEQPLRRQACADFWRRYCQPLPLNIARIISQDWSGPEALLIDLAKYLHGDAPTLQDSPRDTETVLMRHKKIVARIDTFKANWQRFACDLERLICKCSVDKRTYSYKNLTKWLSKVSGWAMKETLDYQLPKELNKFRQSLLVEKTKQGEAPRHELFSAIDELLTTPLTLRDLIISRALSEIRNSIQKQKRQRAELGFDDLLSWMDHALQRVEGGKLAETIRQRYPIAMIDEFQDTDSQQYRIFKKLYVGQKGCGLILIGDPKQAIYAFRGADVFTYMHARSKINAHYTLETNWRSSAAMVDSVNRLFCQVDRPFLFSEIPFIAVKAAEKNHGLVFKLHNKSQPTMHFWLQNGEDVNVSDYQKTMAKLCATQIRDWLSAGQKGQAWLGNEKSRRPVQASNITVLVRSSNEATHVCDALSALLIPSVYLSSRDSIFETLEAKDLLLLMRAVLMPEQASSLRSAMATGIIGLDALELSILNSDAIAWDALVNEFDKYRMLWQKKGVFPMLSEVMKIRHIAENLLASPFGKRRLTNLLHLGEILQKAATQLSSEHALLRWLEKQIAEPNNQDDSQKLRLDSDHHLVRVISIHKSKGLEFDLVWLPFISNFFQNKQTLYHDRCSFELLLDLNVNKNSLALAEEERLSEDLRLLYVALTRSVYHSSIGIAPLTHGICKKKIGTDLHRSALGYLVQAGKSGNAAYLHKCLKQLVSSSIALSFIERIKEQRLLSQKTVSTELVSKRFTRKIKDFWRVTSYTGLLHGSKPVIQDTLPEIGIDVIEEKAKKTESIPTPHTFPRGPIAGAFLHTVLEALDFTQPIDEQCLLKQLQHGGFGDHWQPILLEWIKSLLMAPLNQHGLTLSALAPHYKQAEFKFYMAINRFLQAQDFDNLVKCYDPISSRRSPLKFQKVKGMLKGFIDLVFFWEGKYYLLDYKSNWLGEDNSAYTQLALERVMIEHRYDLQYQLYTLALHRYLRQRLAVYDYQHHFGEVIYLFLRGIDTLQPGNGVFICRPQQKLVEDMDLLFSSRAL